MNESPLWRVSNLAISLLALLVAVLVIRRRSPDGLARSTLALIATNAVAISVMGAAFILEPILWTLFDRGALGLPTTLSAFSTLYGVLHHAIEPALLPAAAITLVVATTRTRISCILLSGLVTATALVLYDIAIRVFLTAVPTPLVFSILGDLVGGMPAGAVLGGFGFSVSTGWTPPRPTLRHAFVGLTAFGTILSTAMGGYLFFLYYLPEHVVLDIRDWDTVSFSYTGIHFPYSSPLSELAAGFPISAGGAGWLAGPIAGHGSVIVSSNRPGNPDGTEPVLLTVAELATDVWGQPVVPSALMAGAHVVFKGEIAPGEIVLDCDAGPFNMVTLLVGKPVDHRYEALFFLDDKNPTIKITKDPRVLVLLALDGLGSALYPYMTRDFKSNPKDLISIFAGDDAHLKVSGIQQAIVVLGVPPTLTWRLGIRKEGETARFRISLPGGKTVQADNRSYFSKKGAPWASGVALVLGKVTDVVPKTIVASVGRQTICPSCKVQLKPQAPLTETVTDFRGEGIAGRLQVGLTEYELKTSGDLLLGNGTMKIERLPDGGTRIAGRTAPVAMNSIVLSKTLWGTLSDATKTLLLTAIGTLFVGLAGRIWRWLQPSA